MVIDLRWQKIFGKDAAIALEEAGMVVNYNNVPHDTNPPANPSGIRLGTPAITSRGMKEGEMRMIAKWMYGVVVGKANKRKVLEEVKRLCRKFQVP